MKKWYRSKTILLAILQAIAGVVIVFETQYGAVGAVLIVKSAVDASLRLITVLPLE
jgi:hypothetical protein